MTAQELLQQARDRGATFEVLESSRIIVQAPSPLPGNLMAKLRDRKSEILGLISRGDCHIGDGNPPPLNRPPRNEAELRRLIDYLGDPVAFAHWYEAIMNRTDS